MLSSIPAEYPGQHSTALQKGARYPRGALECCLRYPPSIQESTRLLSGDFETASEGSRWLSGGLGDGLGEHSTALGRLPDQLGEQSTDSEGLEDHFGGHPGPASGLEGLDKRRRLRHLARGERFEGHP